MNKDNKQENKKALKKLIPVVVVAGIVGGLIGVYAATNSAENLSDIIGRNLEAFMMAASPYLVILISTVGLILEVIIYNSAKKEYAMYEKAVDDEEIDKYTESIDKKNSMALLTGSVTLILAFMFYGATMAYINHHIESESFLYVVALIFFVVVCFGTSKMQQLVVDLEKLMSPEKKGSVYDLNFSSKWEESCDEMEKLLIYKSAYASYRATSFGYAFAVVFLMLMSFFFDYGPLPVMVVCALWLVTVISYCLAAMKYDKEKIN